ncbi:hypothetical protein A1O3_06966 [Capronia epimyces CBS 606.96]|uniref:DUF7924 domain-containing protein n=1 Tax=Capronia epimyces CBS 606.96 TaxID=1182542 RepID=W9XJI5_9EURO|nr:uncharacterized protein A1O3_06966 [Capronia epimyces CBS 606.96]EXJ80682.1 hypothetical protein A1O3_06966 [Capronia epimyces CBS 606.96]
MTEAQHFCPPERRNSVQLSPSPNETCGHASKQTKRTKRNHHGEPRFPPPAFWDNLSSVHLTKRALEELDRRNTQVAAKSRPLSGALCGFQPRVTRLQLQKRTTIPSVTDLLRHCEPDRLRELKKFARAGGPDLSDIRGFPEPIDPLTYSMKSSRSRPPRPRGRVRFKSVSTTQSSRTKHTKSTGPYDRNFQQFLIDGEVYPPMYQFPDGRVPEKPDNWEEIHRRLHLPRRSLSASNFSDKEHEDFVRMDANAAKEKQVTDSVIPIIRGKIGDSKCVSGGIPFLNLDPLLDMAISPGNPDIYYGARPEQLDRRVRDALGKSIIPSTQDDLPIVPNFFLAVKGPNGTLSVATRQATYDGALGERGILSLQSFGHEELVFDNHAHTMSCLYSSGVLQIFTIHCTPPTSPDGRPSYLMHRLRSVALNDTPGAFRDGATVYRNALDWAKEQRDEAIMHANERANDSQNTILAVETSLEEVHSLTSEPVLDQADVTEPLDQEPRISSSNKNDTTINSHDSAILSDRPSLSKQPGKRLRRHSLQISPPRRKRQNARGFDDDGPNQ